MMIMCRIFLDFVRVATMMAPYFTGIVVLFLYVCLFLVKIIIGVEILRDLWFKGGIQQVQERVRVNNKNV